MTITISSEDPRSIKAIEIAAGAGQWLKCRLHCELAKAQQPKPKARPVLDMVRHADGEITWARAVRPSSPQAPASPPSLARPDIFKRFERD